MCYVRGGDFRKCPLCHQCLILNYVVGYSTLSCSSGVTMGPLVNYRSAILPGGLCKLGPSSLIISIMSEVFSSL